MLAKEQDNQNQIHRPKFNENSNHLGCRIDKYAEMVSENIVSIRKFCVLIKCKSCKTKYYGKTLSQNEIVKKLLQSKFQKMWLQKYKYIDGIIQMTTHSNEFLIVPLVEN